MRPGAGPAQAVRVGWHDRKMGDERAVDAAAMEERMDAIRLKQMLGGELSEQELMCLQIEQNGFGCATCSGADATRAPALP
jgi:hypothetical protein